MRIRKFKPFKYPEFRRLWESERLNKEEKNRLFYCSLFDYSSSFEEDVRIKLLDENSKELEMLTKKADRSFFNKYIRRVKNGFFRFIGTDILCRFIIFYELEKKNIKLNRKRFFAKKPSFPDIITLQNQYIEIKRLLSGRNLNECLEDIKNKDYGRVNKIILLLIFPSFHNEPVKRIEDLITGYYLYEKYLSLIMKKQVKIIPYYETGNRLKDIIDQITKMTESFK